MAQAIDRTPNLRGRIFHESEQSLSLQSLAARFAAKEALAKALGDPTKLVWSEIAVVKDELGKPSFEFHGKTAELFTERNYKVFLSLSHEQDVATAIVLLEA